MVVPTREDILEALDEADIQIGVTESQLYQRNAFTMDPKLEGRRKALERRRATLARLRVLVEKNALTLPLPEA